MIGFHQRDRDMQSGIYIIKNMINGKSYCGQSIDVKKRMNEAHSGSNAIFEAINEFGISNFSRKVLIYCEIHELNRLEMECIRIFNSHIFDGGYNISFGGNTPSRGLRHGYISREKMRLAATGRKHSCETLLKMSGKNHHRFGKHLSDEVKEKMRRSNMGRAQSLETRRKIGLANLGKIRKKFKNTSSEYFGVSKLVRGNKYVYYQARVSNTYVGHYKEEIDAALAYDKYVVDNALKYPLNFKVE